jgi:CRP-like cAMP-binding protein
MLTNQETQQLSKAMLKRNFTSGQHIVEQNQEGSSMFILMEGLLEVTVLDHGQRIKVGSLTPPDYFGEMSMLTGEKRSATVTCVSEAIIFEIRQADFMNLLSQREEIIDQIADKISQRKFQNSHMIETERVHQKKQAEEHRHSLIYRIRQFFIAGEVTH